MKKLNIYEIHVLAVLTGILAVIVFSFLFMELDGVAFRKPLSIPNAVLKTEKSEYKPGDVVRAYADFCKHRAIPAQIQWNLVDTYMKAYPSRELNFPVGCKAGWLEIEKIPKDSFQSHYKFYGTVTYKINFVNDVVIHLETTEFVIK